MLVALAKPISDQNSLSAATRAIIWSLALLAIVAVGSLVIAYIKKRLRDEGPQMPGSAAGFTLSELRQMHREGQLSDDEFERAKAKIVAAARKATARDSQKPPGGAGLPGL